MRRRGRQEVSGWGEGGEFCFSEKTAAAAAAPEGRHLSSKTKGGCSMS